MRFKSWFVWVFWSEFDVEEELTSFFWAETRPVPLPAFLLLRSVRPLKMSWTFLGSLPTLMEKKFPTIPSTFRGVMVLGWIKDPSFVDLSSALLVVIPSRPWSLPLELFTLPVIGVVWRFLLDSMHWFWIREYPEMHYWQRESSALRQWGIMEFWVSAREKQRTSIKVLPTPNCFIWFIMSR